jgi:predicted ester cyclase
MSEENKATVRRLMDEVWNQGNLDAIDEGLAPDFVNHDAPPGLPSDREGFKQLAVMYKAAFPDMHLHVEDQLAEGDMVVSRWSAHGTHQGELMGIAPTGKEVTVTGIDIDRFEGGQIVET